MSIKTVPVLEQKHIDAVRQSFIAMNAYANGDTKNGTTVCVDPQAIMGEVYFALAQSFADTLREWDEANQ